MNRIKRYVLTLLCVATIFTLLPTFVKEARAGMDSPRNRRDTLVFVGTDVWRFEALGDEALVAPKLELAYNFNAYFQTVFDFSVVPAKDVALVLLSMGAKVYALDTAFAPYLSLKAMKFFGLDVWAMNTSCGFEYVADNGFTIAYEAGAVFDFDSPAAFLGTALVGYRFEPSQENRIRKERAGRLN